MDTECAAGVPSARVAGPCTTPVSEYARGNEDVVARCLEKRSSWA